MVGKITNRNKSITHRFLVYLLIIIVLSNVMVFGVLYYITQKNMRQQSIDMGQNLMQSNLTTMEQYFEEIDNIAASIIYNKDVIGFMKSKLDSAKDLDFLYGVESLYYNSRPDLQLEFYKANNSTNKYSINQTRNGIAVDDYRYSKWYQEIVWTKEPKIVIVNNTDEENPDFVHSVVYKIEDLYEDGVVGYLKVDMDLNSLKEHFLQGYTKIAGTTISDENGNTLFYDKKVVKVPDEIYNNQSSGIYETKEYIMSYGVSENTGWHLCMAISKDELFKSQRAMIRMLILILLSIISITILISNKCFSVITVNFKRLVQGMELVKQGNLTTQVEVDTPDEISLLIQEFNDMMKRVDELVKTVESKQILLKEAEIKALQQQINPHFMHNIMETIMGLASEGMDEEVITVSKCMSAMLRYNTRFENITVIREEMKQIQNYIMVLKIRFEDRFEAFYDVDDECMDSKIVKFTLQPLVENAISHGLNDTYSGGMLRVRIKKEAESVSILIFDNGSGIEQEKLTELNRRLKETSERPLEYIEQYKSLGLLNVHLRLKMYYGEKYSMEIFSKEGKGTCISIKIPFEGKEETVNVQIDDRG